MIVKNVVDPKNSERLANARKRLAAGAERRAADNGAHTKRTSTPYRSSKLIADAKTANRRHPNGRRHSIGF